MKIFFNSLKQVQEALVQLLKEGELERFIVTGKVLLRKKWIFSAPINVKRTLFHKSAARFAAPSCERVLYLSVSSLRSLFESSKVLKVIKNETIFEVLKKGNPEIKSYLVTIKKPIRLLSIENESQILSLNTALNRLLEDNLQDIVIQAIYETGEESYVVSQYLADGLFKIGFDGILYKPQAPLFGENGPILGSPNEPNLIIFETDRKNIILDVPPDAENLT